MWLYCFQAVLIQQKSHPVSIICDEMSSMGFSLGGIGTMPLGPLKISLEVSQ
jgi:hypothetical protein